MVLERSVAWASVAGITNCFPRPPDKESTLEKPPPDKVPVPLFLGRVHKAWKGRQQPEIDDVMPFLHLQRRSGCLHKLTSLVPTSYTGRCSSYTLLLTATVI